MVDETIEVGGTDVSARDMKAAIEDSGLFRDGEIRDAATELDGLATTNGGMAGDITVVPDGDDDTWGRVFHGGKTLWHGRITEVYKRAEDAIDTFDADGYSGFVTVERLRDEGASEWNVMAVADTSCTHGSTNVETPKGATVQYVNNTATSWDTKDYYEVDVPEDGVVLFLHDPQAE